MPVTGFVRYTATRSLAADHQSGVPYTFPVNLQEATPSAQAVRSREQSDGGQAEAVLDRMDHLWELTFEPAAGVLLENLREFLDSTEAGELFRCWPFGDESQPLILKRIDDGHTEAPFLRRGARDTDVFAMTVTALQTVESDQGESIDIYDPDIFGDGSLDANPDEPHGFIWDGDGYTELIAADWAALYVAGFDIAPGFDFDGQEAEVVSTVPPGYATYDGQISTVTYRYRAAPPTGPTGATFCDFNDCSWHTTTRQVGARVV